VEQERPDVEESYGQLRIKLTDGGHKMVKMSIREIYGEIPENSNLEKSISETHQQDRDLIGTLQHSDGRG
jgi:hypothetical protein